MATYEVKWQKTKLYKKTKRKDVTNGTMRVQANGVFAAKNAAKFRLGFPLDDPNVKVSYSIIGAIQVSP